jgi:hypothetical protein
MHLPRIIRAAAVLAFPCLAYAVDFAVEVHPILAARCAPCHSGAKPAAGLSLTTRALTLTGGASGPAIVPGNSGASLLIAKVSGQRGAIMPASGEPLTAPQISGCGSRCAIRTPRLLRPVGLAPHAGATRNLPARPKP